MCVTSCKTWLETPRHRLLIINYNYHTHADVYMISDVNMYCKFLKWLCSFVDWNVFAEFTESKYECDQ